MWSKEHFTHQSPPFVLMVLIGFGLGLVTFHGVSPRDSLMENCNKITDYFCQLVSTLLKR